MTRNPDPSKTPMPEVIYIYGDQFARQARDSSGLPLRIYTLLRNNAWKLGVAGRNGIPVYDRTVKGNIHETLKQVSNSNIKPGSAVVLMAGAADAKGGGPPLRSFAAALDSFISTVSSAGARPLVVLAPPCPKTANRIAGYAKGSRRWLRRIRVPATEVCEQLRVPLLLPEIEDNNWSDQLSLRPDGVQSLCDQVSHFLIHDAGRGSFAA